MHPGKIELRHIKKKYRQGAIELEVLKDISASFYQGTSYAITGVSGSGKSTLLHTIAGIEIPSGGSLFVNGIDINESAKEQKEKILNEHFGLVFQQPYLITELTVIENIMLKGLIAKKSFSECYQKALVLLEKLGLSDKKDSTPARLSGGQQQRVAIIRAIFNEPPFLVADEPTANLDELHAQTVIDLLLECQRQWNMCLIVSTHDMHIARQMDHQFQLHNGQLQELDPLTSKV